MGDPVKNQVEIGLSKLFYLRGHTIDTYYQAVFNLKDSGLYDEEGNKINASKPLAASKRQSGYFVSFVMTIHPDQADPNRKHICMTCKSFVQLPLDVNGIDAISNTQMLKNPIIF